MADHHAVRGLLGGPDHVERLGERADLVHLDQDRVRRVVLDPSLQALRIGHEQVVADDLDAFVQALGERRPSLPVVLGQGVLDRHDRVRVDQLGEERDHLLGGPRGALEVVRAVAVQLRARRIHRQGHLAPRLQARRLDGLDQQLQRLGGGVDLRSEPALVTDRGGQAAPRELRRQRVEHLGPPPEPLGERGRTQRDQHELLQLQGIVGVPSTVDHVHHRDRQHVGVRPAQVAVQGELQRRGGRPGHGQGHSQDGVRAEGRLVRRTVQVHQESVDSPLVQGVEPFDLGRDLLADVAHRHQHALPGEAVGIGVPELHRLVAARGRAGRHRRPPQRAVDQDHVDLDRGVATGVQHLAGAHLFDQRHGVIS